MLLYPICFCNMLELRFLNDTCGKICSVTEDEITQEEKEGGTFFANRCHSTEIVAPKPHRDNPIFQNKCACVLDIKLQGFLANAQLRKTR